MWECSTIALQQALHFVEPAHRSKSRRRAFSMKNSRVALGSTSLRPARKSSRRHLERIELRRRWRYRPGRASRVARKRRRAIMPTSWHKRFEVGADVAVGCARRYPRRFTSAASGIARVWILQDLQAAGRAGHANLDLAIEAARPPQRRVEHLGNIGRAEHDHLAARRRSRPSARAAARRRAFPPRRRPRRAWAPRRRSRR